MLKRKLLMYFTMVIGLLVMFGATNAMAQDTCPAPDSCTTTSGGYTLTAVPGEGGEFPVKTTCINNVPTTPESVNCYKYEYEYSGTGDVSKIDHIYFAIPHNCYDPINVFENVTWDGGTYKTTYREPGEGAGNVPYADFVYSVRVVNITPQPNKAIFFTDTNRTGSGSHYISAGNKKYGCGTPIITPGYDPVPPTGGRTFSECANFGQDTAESGDDVSFSVLRSSDNEGCITRAFAHEGFDCPGDGTQITPEDLPDDYVLQASFLRTCPDENISVTHGSPWYLYKFYSGGRLYQMCLNLGTGSWDQLTCCTEKGSCDY